MFNLYIPIFSTRRSLNNSIRVLSHVVFSVIDCFVCSRLSSLPPARRLARSVSALPLRSVESFEGVRGRVGFELIHVLRMLGRFYAICTQFFFSVLILMFKVLFLRQNKFSLKLF